MCRVRPGRLVQNLYQEALEVSAALRVQGLLQGDVVFLQIQVLYRLQVDLWVHSALVTSQKSKQHWERMWHPKVNYNDPWWRLAVLHTNPVNAQIFFLFFFFTSERPTMMRMSVSSSVPAPFMAALRRRAK